MLDDFVIDDLQRASDFLASLTDNQEAQGCAADLNAIIARLTGEEENDG